MNQEDKKLTLQKVSLLQTLEAAELEYLLPFVKLLQFPANTSIIQQGKPGNGMYIIKSGSVQVNVRLPGNIENKIATLVEQDFFGEATLIDGGITTASIATLTKTQCYFISTAYFNMLQLSAPVIAYKITVAINRGVSARLHYINQQIAGRLIDIKNTNYTNPSLTLSKPLPASINNLMHLHINTDFLLNLGVFKYFDQSEINELFKYLRLRKAARSCILFSEKEPATAFYLVAQGAAQMTIVKNNKISKLSVVGPGGIFGLLSYFDHNIHVATATAREEIVILEFKYTHMELLQQQNALLFYKWYFVISQTLIAMLRAADKDLIRLASRLA
jgi:CRP-like cAMP-binding protein